MIVIIFVLAAAAAVAMFVVNVAFLEEVIGVLKSAVVVSVMMLVKLYCSDHFDASTFLPASCNSRQHFIRHCYITNCIYSLDVIVGSALG